MRVRAHRCWEGIASSVSGAAIRRPRLIGKGGLCSRAWPHGIDAFDTTCRPQRVALGKALAAVGGQVRARVLAWNFFRWFGPGEEVGGPAAYEADSIRSMVDELQMQHVDCRVVHPRGNAQQDRRQENLAVQWQAAGLVRQLGLWAPAADVAERCSSGRPYSFMVRPCNVTTPAAGAAFAACQALGWTTFACSPFVRGWELERLLKAAGAAEDEAARSAAWRTISCVSRFTLPTWTV